jgi:hypothetical protein
MLGPLLVLAVSPELAAVTIIPLVCDEPIAASDTKNPDRAPAVKTESKPRGGVHATVAPVALAFVTRKSRTDDVMFPTGCTGTATLTVAVAFPSTHKENCTEILLQASLANSGSSTFTATSRSVVSLWAANSSG